MPERGIPVRTIIWMLYFWITLFFLVPAMLHAKRLEADGKTEELDGFVRRKVTWWMGSLLRLAGVRVHNEGRENLPGRPAVIVSNHQGNFDIPILLCHLDRPHGILAKEELARLPFIRVWMQFFGCVFIDRSNPRHAAAALNRAADQLRAGRSMIIFPEGTRSRGDEVGEFKSGGFRIAQKVGVPIVPVAIDGSWRAMEGNHMRIHPAEVRLKILPPIETAGLSREAFRSLEGEIREQIVRAKRNP